MAMDIQYRPIEGFPGYRVRSDSVVESSWCRGRRPSRTSDTWRPLKPTPQHRGHLAVCLVLGSEKHTRHVHRILLEAFAGPCPEGLECCHNDGDPADNRLENLRWDIRKANFDARWRHGTMRFGEGANAKLREEDVLEIRRLKAEGVPMDRLAEAFGVSRPNIEAIVYRRSWRHLEPASVGRASPAVGTP
jgi:hypothetical protein